jgi:uncharacterized membrane protein
MSSPFAEDVPNHRNTQRLEAFSDGVFAIAITLLILEIKIPKHEDIERFGGLASYLTHLWPSYLAYVFSFVMIGIYWSNHHWLLRFVYRTNHTFNLLHIFFLMAVCFLPFPTAIFGEFFTNPALQIPAITTWCVGFFLPIAPTLALILYAFRRHRLVHPRLNRGFMRNLVLKMVASLTFSLIAIASSFWFPMIALSLMGMMWLLFFLPPAEPVYDEEPTGTME